MRTQINNTLLLGAMLISTIAAPVYSQVSLTQPYGMFSTKNHTREGEFKKARFGFKVSPNFSWVKVMEGRMKNNGTALGISYGIMADFNIAGNASYWLGTELIVTALPGKIAALDTLYNTHVSAGATPFTKAEFDYRLQYVQLPITLKLKTNEIGNLVYYGQFGISPGMLIQNKVTTNTKEQFYLQGTSSHIPNSDNNNNLDFDGNGTKGSFQDNIVGLRASMVIGIGVEIKISGKTAASVGLRFDNGFTDMFWDKLVKGRNNYLGLHAGIYF